MAYRLCLDGDVAGALRRVLAERVESAARRLEEQHADDPVEAVHRARTDLKKARAALRLAAPGMPKQARREADRALRDRGRALASTRDADVALETLEALAERFPDRLDEAALEAVRPPLAVRAAGARQAGPVLAEEAAALRALAHEVRSWPLDGCDLTTLARGIARAQSRGRAAFGCAREEPTPERLHEWRKRVKDLWYQLRLLRAAWPEVMKAHAGQARALSRLLGDDHDLAVLAELVPTGVVPELAAERRTELEREAMALGDRLYAERPRALRRRIDRLLHAA